MNNSVLGKTQENFRNRVNVELVTNARLLRTRVAKPTFYRGRPITDCLTIIQCKVAILTLNRPIYVGFTVLELSKLHMYGFHYNHMKVKYPHANQLQLLFTDTDSLAYAVQTDDIYRDMAIDAADRYDHRLYLIVKHLDFQRRCEFCTNARICWASTEIQCFSLDWTAKGVRRKVKDEHLHFAHYLDTLRNFKSCL